jgi:hypothetical protein
LLRNYRSPLLISDPNMNVRLHRPSNRTNLPLKLSFYQCKSQISVFWQPAVFFEFGSFINCKSGGHELQIL